MINQFLTLTVISLKMYYRNKVAIFFSLFIPVFIIVIFGLIFSGNGNQNIKIALNDKSQNDSSKSFVKALDESSVFSISDVDSKTGMDKLKKGDVDIYIEIPSNFGTKDAGNIIGYYDEAKAQNSQLGFLIIDNILGKYNDIIYSNINRTTIPAYISLDKKGIQTNNLGEIDFIVPGLIAFSIMQLGLFSVAFAFTGMKASGSLRRLQVTPAKAYNFILAQSVARLILTIIQVLILLSIGVFAFKLHMYGNLGLFLCTVLIGSMVFLSFGFAIAGYAKDENQAAPITNLVSFPMMFLSGIFFPIDLLPDWLKNITTYSPLAFLADALRQIANNGVGISSIQNDLVGLIIWAVIGMIIAAKLFRWE